MPRKNKLTWFTQQRMMWIHESVMIFGFINRQHIMDKFWVSMPQASADLKLYQKRNPCAIEYDTKRKCYVRARG